MNAIVGLVEHKDSLDNGLRELCAAGFKAQGTHLPAPSNTIAENLASNHRRSSPRATALGAGVWASPLS